MKIITFITSADMGGTQRMIIKLFQKLSACCEVHLVVLKGSGDLSDKFEQAFESVTYLRIHENFLKAIQKLYNIRKENNFDIIESWLYHANIIATFFSSFMPRPKIWHIRSSLHAYSEYKKTTKWVIQLARFLSGKPHKIIYNSLVSLNQHQKFGFNHRAAIHIPNGFETKRFVPSSDASIHGKMKSVSGEKEIVIGYLGRYHEEKNPVLFIEAANKLLKERGDVRFVMGGEGITEANGSLTKRIRAYDLQEKLQLRGLVEDVVSFYNNLDVFWLTSQREAFPNVVGEAMLCGVPCVSTDVGDVRGIIGETGRIITDNVPTELANATIDLIGEPEFNSSFKKEQIRNRIVEHFSIEKVAADFLDVYKEAAKYQIK